MKRIKYPTEGTSSESKGGGRCWQLIQEEEEEAGGSQKVAAFKTNRERERGRYQRC